MDINLLVNITSRAWSLSILARMHEGVPGRQAQLLNATSAGRTAFTQSMHHLIDLGLLERNPGHGHPLRPEYRLTSLGRAAAPIAHRIETATPRAQNVLIRRSWTVPILALSTEPLSYSALKQTLPRITDRALSQTLQRLIGEDWLIRDQTNRDQAARVRYCATGTGMKISRTIGLPPPRIKHV